MLIKRVIDDDDGKIATQVKLQHSTILLSRNTLDSSWQCGEWFFWPLQPWQYKIA